MVNGIHPINRALSVVAPVWALRREAARRDLQVMAGSDSPFGYRRKKGTHRGANTDTQGMVNWKPTAESPDEDLHGDLDTLRARSRDLERNEPLCGGGLDTQAVNTVGCGLRLRTNPDYETLGISSDEAQTWGQNVERLWGYFCNECDYRGELSFEQLQFQMFFNTLLSGDVFAILPSDQGPDDIFQTKIQLIEADLICNPMNRADTKTIREGVEYSAGRPVAYHVASTYSYKAASPENWERVARQENGRWHMLHMKNARRPGQSRGVPALARVIEHIKSLGDFRTQSIKAAILSALYNIFIRPSEELQSDTAIDVTGPDGVSHKVEQPSYQLGTAAVHRLQPGEEIDAVQSGHPSSEFGSFLSAVLESISSGINLPKQQLLQHFDSSYSASRAAFLMAFQFARMWRTHVARGFCMPVFHNWLDEAVAMGLVEARGYFDSPLLKAAWRRANWQGEPMPQIDPVKEAAAAKTRLETNVSTLDQEISQHSGESFEGHYPRLLDEAGKIREIKTRRGDTNVSPEPVDPSLLEDDDP